MSVLPELFLSFAKVGVMTFGGGYAMLPILQNEVVEKKKWISQEDLTDCYAIGQCTPGVIAVNTATFVGYRQKGVPGAVCATLGVVFPSLVIITIIAAFIRNFADLPVVKNAFAGVRICVCVLVLNTVIKLWKTTIISKASLIIFIAVLLLAALTGISKVILVVAAGVTGLAIHLIRKRRAES
ncbi:MAG: chromate transporter [Oscillospiraceae bacterium]|nr:chromate transporter [Oscillospiraceae bacterium]MBR6429800.1 chromate transporter [Oscillospiraceae bacterium]